MNAPVLREMLATSVECDAIQAKLAAATAEARAMDAVTAKIAMLWLSAAVRNFRWAHERGHDTAAAFNSMAHAHDQFESALKAAELSAVKPPRTLQDAVSDAQAIIHERRAHASREARLPYPKDEEIDRG